MIHKHWGLLALALMTVVTAEAGVTPGVISGLVKNTAGSPQRSAVVQIYAAASAPLAELRTDDHGRFKASGLKPGSYTVKVTAPSFLPTIRERVMLRAGASVIVNLTLNTLFEAIQMAPRRGGTAADKDDWRWTLRSMANRPILRLVDDGPLVVVHSGAGREDEGVLKARVSFMAGEGSSYGSANSATNFQIESSHVAAGRLGVSGGFANDGGQGARLRAGYVREMPNGSSPEIGLSLQRYASPELAARRAALETMAMRISNNAAFGRVEVEYGGLLQQAELNHAMHTSTLFASARAHVTDNMYLGFASTALETGEPTLDSPFQLNRGGYDPRVTQAGGRTRIERGRRNEATLAAKRGKNRVQIGYYRVNARDMALEGAGAPGSLDAVSTANLTSASFLLNGGDHRLSGYNVTYQRKVNEHLTLAGVYDRGDVLTSGPGALTLAQIASNMRVAQRNSVGAQAKGKLAGGTSYSVSYRWTEGEALSNMNAYGQGSQAMAPKLNVQLRQPLPLKLTQCSVEVMVDVRNLLAEGYRPVLSSDGTTLYLAPLARSVSGGLSFTF